MTVRIGVIGCGMIAQRAHLLGYAACPDAEIVALCDVMEDRLQEVAAKYEVGHTFTDYRRLLEMPEIDAVSVCTPNALHAPMTIDALHAGKHVLVEKPMAITIAEADAMVDAANRAGKFLMVEQAARFDPVSEVAKEILDSGRLGRVLVIKAALCHGGPEHWSPTGKWFFNKAEAGFGTMADLGIHKADLIRWLTGKEASEVAGFMGTLEKSFSEVEDNAVAVMKFTDGTLGMLQASWTSKPVGDASLVAFCENGVLQVWVDPNHPVVVNVNTPHERLTPDIPGRSKWGGPYTYFVNCIQRGEKPFVSGEEGRESLRIVLGAIESSQSKRVVQLR